MTSDTLKDTSMSEKLNYLENGVFDDLTGAEIEEANEEEWGDWVVVWSEETTSSDDGSGKETLKQYAQRKVKSEDEWFFEKIMWKHPEHMTDTICLFFEAKENNVFR